MEIRILITIITSIAGVLIPIILWFLNKRDKNLYIEYLDEQNKTLTLIEHLQTICSEKDIDKINSIKEKEIERSLDILNFHRQNDKPYDYKFKRHKFKNLNALKVVLLIFKPRTFIVGLLQFIYFIMIFNAVSGLYSLFFEDTIQEMMQEEHISYFLVGLIVFIVFFIQVLLIYVINRLTIKLQFKEKPNTN